MAYTVRLAEKLIKKLDRLAKKDRERVMIKIDALAGNPRSGDYKKLKGNRRPTLYRVRAGIYRVVYCIQDDVLVVLVVDIGHRKEIYR